ncbi:MAG: cytochrome-c peroxidase [Planctomycetota bacterium]|jgi:cytochrome c peroxidase
MHTRRILGLASAAALAAIFFAPAATSQQDQSLPNPPDFPFENPLLENQDILGKFLFWEEQMSFDNTMACGTCHIHEAGGQDPRALNTTNPHPGPDGLFGTVDDIKGSAGVVHTANSGDFVGGGPHFPLPRVTGRRTPTTINSALNTSLFWDGRAPTEYTDPQTGLIEIGYLGALESQAAGPPTSDVEMTREGQTWDDITAKLAVVKPGALMSDLPPEMVAFRNANPTYGGMFAAVYGDPAITSKRVMFAIANYERTLMSDETPLDEFLDGTVAELAPELEAGRVLFTGKANCSGCHVMPLTHDNDFHNIGVRPDEEDIGREAVTGDPADKAKFKTPHIRNLSLRAPYFHDGSRDTIEEVVEFYDVGGDFPGPNLDVLLLPLNLTEQEKADLVLFLEVATLDPRVVNNEFPFTRPTLASELPSLNSAFGIASLNGAGVAPEVLTHVPANQGHPNWLLGVHEATPNATTIAAFSFASDDGSPFPDPRFPIPMNIDVGSLFLLVPSTTDGLGVDTVSLSVPLEPALAGMKFYVQWFIKDVDALATGGVYGSEGVEVEIL